MNFLSNGSNILFLLFILYLLWRSELNQHNRRKEQRKNEEMNLKSMERQKQGKEEVVKAQAKRDEVIRLLGEISQNQREILSEIKHQAEDYK